MFGVGDRPFIVAVRLAYQPVMTVSAKVVVRLVTVAAVNPCGVTFISRKGACPCSTPRYRRPGDLPFGDQPLTHRRWTSGPIFRAAISISMSSSDPQFGLDIASEPTTTAPQKRWAPAARRPATAAKPSMGRTGVPTGLVLSRRRACAARSRTGRSLHVGPLGLFITAATGDVGVHPREQHLGSRPLERGEIDWVLWQ